jgi:hypothetical protein
VVTLVSRVHPRCACCAVFGCRQSRLLRFDEQGYQLYTVDHGDAGRMRLDLAQTWASTEAPSPILPGHDLIAESDAGWLCSQLDCSLQEDGASGAKGVQWLAAGPNVLLAVQDDLLVEYDMQMRAPLGIVAFLEGGLCVRGYLADEGSGDGGGGAGVRGYVETCGSCEYEVLPWALWLPCWWVAPGSGIKQVD